MDHPSRMRILISGAGVAGPTLAYWLARHGFEPTLVERAPRLRTGGYAIDFWGTGYEVADRMGIVPQLRATGYDVQEVRMVDGRGRRVGGFPVDAFRRAAHGRYVTVPRGDLAAELYRALGDGVETVFGDEITALEQRADGVRVGFAHAAPQTFELVIGADGLHSAVRRIAFGAEPQFDHDLGCAVAAFEVSGYQPRDPDAYIMHLEVGKQIARFSLRGDRTMFLFVWRDDGPASEPAGELDRRADVRARFAGGGWECAEILAAMDCATEVYFDRMSQIRMPRWSDGRVALVGDAAYCPTLLAGEGSALAMAGAYVLAGELAAAGGDHVVAFRRYEELLRPMIEAKQRGAERFLSSFAPPSRRSLFFQTRVTRLLGWSWLAERLARRWLDPIELPDYENGARS